MANISDKDRIIIRDLAKKQMEYAKSPEMMKLREEWLLHNTLRGERPMVTVELGTFSGDVLPGLMKCEGSEARNIEAMLLSNIVNHELFKDDTIVKDYIPVTWSTFFKPFNIDEKVDRAVLGDGSKGLGHHFVPQIKDLHDDFYKFKKSAFGVNREGTLNHINYLNDIIGDIIPVRLCGRNIYTVPTQNIVHIMDMEDMFMAMYDYPDEFKEMMSMLANDYLEYFKFLEDENLLLPTVADEWLAQGTYCFTDELPGYDEIGKRKLTTKDVWGFLDSQETVGVSVDMFEEFIFPAYKKIAECYGLLSYGCCEPVDSIWERCLSKLPNLRKLSISPWCNEEKMGEMLAGSKVIYHRKPSPNFLGVGSVLDEEGLRNHIRKTLDAAKGCKIEFTQRDVYSINKDIKKVRRYVEIIREEIAR